MIYCKSDALKGDFFTILRPLDLGGNADEAQMQSGKPVNVSLNYLMSLLDNYRANIRKRARELIQWILVSGDSKNLGVTKDNIISKGHT